jgi:hypothetical protein
LSDLDHGLEELERDHTRDREDVRSLVTSGLVDAGRLFAHFQEIEPCSTASRRSIRRRFGRA